MIAERGMGMEAQILEVIRDILRSPHGEAGLTIKSITSWFTHRHGTDYEKKLTTKWIGAVIRKKLNLKTYRTREGYVISAQELSKLERLYEKYGVLSSEDENDSPETSADSNDPPI